MSLGLGKRKVPFVCLLVLAAGCSKDDERNRSASALDRPIPSPNRTTADRLGTRFIADGFDVQRAPVLVDIPLPTFPGADSVWGSSGRDDDGNIWFGVSVKGVDVPSARLFSFSPKEDLIKQRGDVVTWMRQLDIYRGSKPSSMYLEGQMKIHSKIVQADDGYIYFASMDERGESSEPLRNPTWGGHLWRANPRTNRWEHLLAADEGLIAISCSGRYVFVLGYHDHVLYRYDTQTAEVKRVTVGSYKGHVSRNFFTDLNHHVYVPRVFAEPGVTTEHGVEKISAELVEFDENLNELAANVMNEYAATGASNSHGLMGFTYLADGSVVFTSWIGYLWHLHPDPDGPANLEEKGWFHPKGRTYVPTLITYDGENWIAGLSYHNRMGNQWVVRNLEREEATVLEFDAESSHRLLQHRLIYGTNTRDDEGSFYFVGRQRVEERQFPIMLRGTIPTIR